MTKPPITLPELTETAAEAIARALLDDGEEDTAHQIIRVYGDRTTVADDGNCEVETDHHETLREAADEYVSDGDWGDGRRTTDWVTVYAWFRWTLGDLVVDGERESFAVEIEPTEPECVEQAHEWCAHHGVVGGLIQNPGVYGHGAGVIIHEVCRHCGCRKTTNTWAQRPDTGECGLTSVTYAKLGEHDMSDNWLFWSEAEEEAE